MTKTTFRIARCKKGFDHPTGSVHFDAHTDLGASDTCVSGNVQIPARSSFQIVFDRHQPVILGVPFFEGFSHILANDFGFPCRVKLFFHGSAPLKLSCLQGLQFCLDLRRDFFLGWTAIRT